MITNSQSGTNVHEIADGVYRINTPVSIPDGPGKFTFNQFLIVDDAVLLFHTGPRRLFPFVHEALGRVIPVERLRYVAFSHFEAVYRVRLRFSQRRPRARDRPIATGYVKSAVNAGCADPRHESTQG